MNSKMLISVAVMPIALGALVACGQPSKGGSTGQSNSSSNGNSPKLVLKLGHTISTGSHYQKAAEVFASVLNKETNGAVQVHIFPESQLGGEVQMTSALRTGTQDLEITSQAPVVNTDKSWEVLSLPFLFRSLDQGNKVLQGPVGQEFLDDLSKYNLKGLAFMSVLDRDVFSKKPVKTLEDLNGMKIRAIQDPGYVGAYRALGADPTPLAYNELYLAVQQGTVGGGEASPDTMVQDKFDEVAKNFSLTHVNYMPVAIVMSQVTWNKLDSSEQKAVMDAAHQAAQYDVDHYGADIPSWLDKMKQNGVSIWNVDTSSWPQKVAPFVKQEITQIPNGSKFYNDVINAENK